MGSGEWGAGLRPSQVSPTVAAEGHFDDQKVGGAAGGGGGDAKTVGPRNLRRVVLR